MTCEVNNRTAARVASWAKGQCMRCWAERAVTTENYVSCCLSCAAIEREKIAKYRQQVERAAPCKGCGRTMHGMGREGWWCEDCGGKSPAAKAYVLKQKLRSEETKRTKLLEHGLAQAEMLRQQEALVLAERLRRELEAAQQENAALRAEIEGAKFQQRIRRFSHSKRSTSFKELVRQAAAEPKDAPWRAVDFDNIIKEIKK